MKLLKNLLLVLVGILICLGLFYIKDSFQFTAKHKQENATVVLEKIQKVVELTTVKGHISEIYNYKDYYVYDIWPLRKKALVRVKANVSIGYDLESLSIELDSSDRTVVLSEIPAPKILSIDHDLDYYDMQEGIFNVFNTEDITGLSKKAKEFITQESLTSPLFEAAEEQKDDFISLLEAFLIGSGWTLKIGDKILD